jgi:hypothetical protein
VRRGREVGRGEYEEREVGRGEYAELVEVRG